MKLVIVESPAKAKTIEKYLGKDYKVLASFGHIRDLPSKDGSVNPSDDFKMIWELSARGKTCLDNITKELSNCTDLILATDPDREGEAISWHIAQCIKEKKKFANIIPTRIVFHEITQKAIKEAIKNPREIDQNLVDAYLARRSLDYLVGFTLSPILWRKLPGSRSAGRVQSVALRLIVDRENEIESFISQEYWTISSEFIKSTNEKFKAKLTILNNQKLEKFDIKNDKSAMQAVEDLNKKHYKVASIEKKIQKRNPTAPFTTSTLQQEAFRKLSFSTKTTMMVAQKLYEGIKIGNETQALITYMRTDSLNLSKDAIVSIRQLVQLLYGNDYIPESAVEYKNKVKNAQEAHEAIRPIDFNIKPQDLEGKIDNNMLRLYDLIWKRAISSQMSQAIYDKMQVDIADVESGKNIFRANGSAIKFNGFLKVYEEGVDEEKLRAKKEDDENILPMLAVDEKLELNQITPNQHFTEPNGRYSEASLVKKLEELGIGRPSTYATIIQVLQDRGYVTITKKVFMPEFRGRVVTSFLLNYFSKYLQYDFTADLEEKLDDISNNDVSKLLVLNNFWKDFAVNADSVKAIKNTEVINYITKNFTTYIKNFFANNDNRSDARTAKVVGENDDKKENAENESVGNKSNDEKKDDKETKKQIIETEKSKKSAAKKPTKGEKINEESTDKKYDSGEDFEKIPCPECKTGSLFLKTSKFGIFLGCSRYPDCNYLKSFTTANIDRDAVEGESADSNYVKFEDIKLGTHPQSQKEIFFKKGPYGYYFQTDGAKKVVRVAMPKDWSVEKATLENAVFLLSFPKYLGDFDGVKLSVNLGKFGPYISYNKLFIAIPKKYDIQKLTLEEAILILQSSKKYKKPGE